jgi:energy-converting hydrogenase Eha subunit G
MSNTIIPESQRTAGDESEAHTGIEPWLSVSFLALLPLIVAFYVPEAWQPYLFVAGGLLLLIGTVLLIRQERRSSAERRD